MIEDPLLQLERGFTDGLQRSCSICEGYSILVLRGIELRFDEDLIALFLDELENCEPRVLRWSGGDCAKEPSSWRLCHHSVTCM